MHNNNPHFTVAQLRHIAFYFDNFNRKISNKQRGRQQSCGCQRLHPSSDPTLSNGVPTKYQPTLHQLKQVK